MFSNRINRKDLNRETGNKITEDYTEIIYSE
jgi:hypothetical protein